MQLSYHQLRLRGSLFDIFSVTLQALATRQASDPSAARNKQRILRVNILDW